MGLQPPGFSPAFGSARLGQDAMFQNRTRMDAALVMCVRRYLEVKDSTAPTRCLPAHDGSARILR